MQCRRGQPLKRGDRILVPMVVDDVYPERRGDGIHTCVRALVARGRGEAFLADGSAVIRANPGDNIIDLFEDEPVTTETI